MSTALIIVACILFGFAAAGMPTGRVSLLALGLLFFALSFIANTIFN